MFITIFYTSLYNILFKHRCIYLYGCQTHWVLVTCSDIPCIYFYSIYVMYYYFVSDLKYFTISVLYASGQINKGPLLK